MPNEKFAKPPQNRYFFRMTKTISVHLPDSLLVKVDALAPDRDDFLRHAIEEKIARVRRDDTELLDLQRRNQVLRELDDSEGW